MLNTDLAIQVNKSKETQYSNIIQLEFLCYDKTPQYPTHKLEF